MDNKLNLKVEGRAIVILIVLFVVFGLAGILFFMAIQFSTALKSLKTGALGHMQTLEFLYSKGSMGKKNVCFFIERSPQELEAFCVKQNKTFVLLGSVFVVLQIVYLLGAIF